MKKLVCLTYAGFVFTGGLFAQSIETIRVKGQEAQNFIAKEEFRYPEFRSGKVYFNNGESAVARFNYSFLGQRMLFINKQGDTLEMVDENTIAHISVEKDTFYYYDKGYYQLLAGSGTCRLVVKQTLKIGGEEMIGAFGSSSPSKNVQALGAYQNFYTNKLSFNQEMIFIKQKSYYLIDRNNRFLTTNAKNFAKLFPDKKQKSENYIAQNKLNLNNEDDLKKLLVFLNSPG